MPPIDPKTSPETDPGYELIDDPARLRRWVRGFLVAIALLFATIFGIAIWLNPYQDDGSRRTQATHTQLGLPPCNMVQLIGKPCPSCGMTTSFAMLMHGDVVGSAKANWVGTLLALFWLSLIPWAIASALRAKYYFVRSGETIITVAIIVFLVLMFARWGVVLLQT